MATISETFNYLLHLLPVETHKKAKEIYACVPGTLMKFLNTSDIVQKKIECSDNIIIDGKIHLPNEIRNSNDVAPVFTGCRDVTVHNQRNEIPVRPYDSKTVSDKPMDLPKRQISSEPHPMAMENDYRNWDHFRAHFLDSLRNQFQAKYITEINPNEIGNIVFDQYMEQCLKLDKHRKTSSLPIRFEKRFSGMNDLRYMNFGVCYVDAYIICQTEKTWSQKHQTKMNYVVAIEFNGFLQDNEKMKRFEEMVMKYDVPTIIEMMEEKSKLTWEGFLKKK